MAAATLSTQHLLFLFLLVVAPIWDLYAIPKLKRNPTSEKKIRYYKTICTWLWIASALAVVAIGFRPFTVGPSPGEVSWLLPHPWVRYLVEALIAIAFIISVALPVGIVIWKKLTKRPRKYSSAAALESFSYFLPATWTERRWWVRLHHSGSLRRNCLPRLHAALLTRFSLDAESYAGAVDFLSDLRT